MKVLSNSLKKGAFVSLALSLVACTEPLSPTALPSNPPAPRAATPPPPSVEKIQLQAGSGSSDPHAITELKVEPAQLELRPLEVAKVRVLARLANGQTVEVINHSKLQWEIAEPTQITLLNGTVKALAPGESEVLIRAGTQEARLKVKIPEVLDGGSASGSILVQPELVLPQPLYRLAVGENVYLQASLKAADGSESKDLIFSVDKPDLFELDSQSGRLRRLKAGPAKVTVQARLNGDLLKTIALEDKVIESHSAVSIVNSPVPRSQVPSAQPTVIATSTPVPSSVPQPTSSPLPAPVVSSTPMPTPTPTSTPTPLPTVIPTPNLSGARNTIFTSALGDLYAINNDGTNSVQLTNTPAGESIPRWSPNGTKIAFLSGRDGNWEIYLMNSDGTNPQRLTTTAEAEAYINWSPDGKKIVYNIWQQNNDANIWIIDIETLSKTQLTTTGTNITPTWSPDGTKIAFSSNADGKSQLYHMNIDGSNWVKLTNDSKHNWMPNWSPDGTKIVYVTDSGPATEINLLNLSDLTTQQITSNSFADLLPIWSADGSKIYFTSARNGTGNELFEMNADGSGQVNFSGSVIKGFGIHVKP